MREIARDWACCQTCHVHADDDDVPFVWWERAQASLGSLATQFCSHEICNFWEEILTCRRSTNLVSKRLRLPLALHNEFIMGIFFLYHSSSAANRLYHDISSWLSKLITVQKHISKQSRFCIKLEIINCLRLNILWGSTMTSLIRLPSVLSGLHSLSTCSWLQTYRTSRSQLFLLAFLIYSWLISKISTIYSPRPSSNYTFQLNFQLESNLLTRLTYKFMTMFSWSEYIHNYATPHDVMVSKIIFEVVTNAAAFIDAVDV